LNQISGFGDTGFTKMEKYPVPVMQISASGKKYPFPVIEITTYLINYTAFPITYGHVFEKISSSCDTNLDVLD